MIDEKQIKIGYEISFTKYFYKPIKLRSLDAIAEEILFIESQTTGMIDNLIGGE